jgi:hypothetical protein
MIKVLLNCQILPSPCRQLSRQLWPSEVELRLKVAALLSRPQNRFSGSSLWLPHRRKQTSPLRGGDKSIAVERLVARTAHRHHHCRNQQLFKII